MEGGIRVEGGGGIGIEREIGMVAVEVEVGEVMDTAIGIMMGIGGEIGAWRGGASRTSGGIPLDEGVGLERDIGAWPCLLYLCSSLWHTSCFSMAVSRSDEQGISLRRAFTHGRPFICLLARYIPLSLF